MRECAAASLSNTDNDPGSCLPATTATYVSYLFLYKIFCEQSAGGNRLNKGFFKMVCEGFAGEMRVICGVIARMDIDYIAE